MTTIAQEIREFVITNFLFGRQGADLADSQSFLDSGIIDSTGVLELVSFLEERFGITVGDRELLPENLDSVDNAARFIAAKLAETEISGLPSSRLPVRRGLVHGRPSDVALLCAVASVLIAVYWAPIGGLISTWTRSPMYSYGFTVPLISAYLIWERRRDLAQLSPAPAVIAGGSALLAAFALTIVGAAAGIQILQQVALIVAIAAAVLMIFGGA